MDNVEEARSQSVKSFIEPKLTLGMAKACKVDSFHIDKEIAYNEAEAFKHDRQKIISYFDA